MEVGVNQGSYSLDLDPDPPEMLTITSLLILLNKECAITNIKNTPQTKRNLTAESKPKLKFTIVTSFMATDIFLSDITEVRFISFFP